MEENGRAVRTQFGGRKPEIVSEKQLVGGRESRNCSPLIATDVLSRHVSHVDRPPSRSVANGACTSQSTAPRRCDGSLDVRPMCGRGWLTSIFLLFLDGAARRTMTQRYPTTLSSLNLRHHRSCHGGGPASRHSFVALQDNR